MRRLGAADLVDRRQPLPPAIRPGLHCGYERNLDIGGKLVELPPAIRPGLHCGVMRSEGAPHTVQTFPRPSGRGSIAAWPSRCPATSGRNLPPAIRPGLHCGRVSAGRLLICCGLPPAIRPGLHCGPARAENCCRVWYLPPAIRPGLHCGTLPGRATNAQTGTSPGHQAGAPLRHVARRVLCDLAPSSPGHQAGAPLRPDPADLLALPHDDFPRPSGRGSIAALSSTARCCAPWALPPAIRPGLHCGTACL